ncbi:hypothetical protein EDD86DRAFT_102007 [Gorgonomyces haynaldii]|nr:hypothetical protein EDD86DRAFT_102007 [Gorgonomyces haynaldii]
MSRDLKVGFGNVRNLGDKSVSIMQLMSERQLDMFFINESQRKEGANLGFPRGWILGALAGPLTNGPLRQGRASRSRRGLQTRVATRVCHWNRDFRESCRIVSGWYLLGSSPANSVQGILWQLIHDSSFKLLLVEIHHFSNDNVGLVLAAAWTSRLEDDKHVHFILPGTEPMVVSTNRKLPRSKLEGRSHPSPFWRDCEHIFDFKYIIALWSGAQDCKVWADDLDHVNAPCRFNSNSASAWSINLLEDKIWRHHWLLAIHDRQALTAMDVDEFVKKINHYFFCLFSVWKETLRFLTWRFP